MIVPAHVTRWHGDRVAPCGVLRDTVRGVVTPFVELRKYLFLDRVKTVESLAEKLESGRYDSLDAIDDFYAATIVVPSLEHEAGVLKFLKGTFREERTKGRSRTSKDPEAVRFDATRFYGRLHPSRLERDPRIDEMLFEIQVQTAFEHAWVVVTHDTVFKANVVDWRRKRLAALLKANVEQLDLLLVGFEAATGLIDPSHWEEFKQKNKLLEFFQGPNAVKGIPEEALPAAWSRFADNVYALCAAESRRRGVAPRIVVAELIAVFEAKLNAEGWSAPRSISLFQTTFGVAAETRVIGPPLPYAAILNDELAQLFPAVNVFKQNEREPRDKQRKQGVLAATPEAPRAEAAPQGQHPGDAESPTKK